jgi:hypothetical protein
VLSGLIAAASGLSLVGTVDSLPAHPLQEPLLPQPSSLTPVDTEAFRQRHGQEALFRLMLGVDSGERTSTLGIGSAAGCADGWAKAPQAQGFQAALNRKQWYEAGETLGRWRRQCGTGG